MSHPRSTLLILLSGLALSACALPPPSHAALYPPDEAELSQYFNITHDRYHPWEFQPVDSYGGGRH